MNRLEQWVDQPGEDGIKLGDADQLFVLKPQLVEAGLARVQISEEFVQGVQ
jgi:hypothetical protein